MSLIPLSLRRATTGFISFVKVRGAQDRSKADTETCTVRPAIETEGISGDWGELVPRSKHPSSLFWPNSPQILHHVETLHLEVLLHNKFCSEPSGLLPVCGLHPSRAPEISEKQNPFGLVEPPLRPVSLTLSVSLLIPIPAVLVTAVIVGELMFELADLQGVVGNLELSVVPRDPDSAGPNSL